MSVERSGSPVSPKVSPGAEIAGSKGKVKPGDAADGSAEAGFLAVLTSLVPEVVAADSVESSLAQAPEVDQSENLAMLMAQAGEVAVARSSQMVASSPVVGVPQVPDTPVAATPLAPTDTKSTALSIAGDPAPVLASVVADGVVGVQFKAPEEEVPAGTARPSLKHLSSSAASDKSDIAVDVLDAGTTDLVVKSDVAISALLDRAKPATAARVIQNPGISHLQSATAATAADSRSANVTSVFQDLASMPTLAGAVAASGWSEGLSRPSDRPGSKLAGLQSALGIEGAGGGHFFQAGSRADFPSATVNPSMPSFESAVAEKLNYWIAQGVQNAELELDGFGDEPVAVRISLKGDEAHIGFRTDQPEIRRLLEGASAQLKDLLASEGLQLSQVSVGTSGQGGSGQQERRPPTGARAGTTKGPDMAVVQGARRPGVAVGAAVDLFV